MNNQDPSTWQTAGQSSYDQLGAAMPEDDFSNFLDLDNLGFDFNVHDDHAYDGALQQKGQPTPAESIQEYPEFDQYETCPPTLPGQQPTLPSQHDGHAQKQVADVASGGDYQMYQQPDGSQQWQAQQQMHGHGSVPPTPNSSGMYPTHYIQQVQHQHPYGQRQEAFNQLTPLTSPHFVDSGATHAIPGYGMQESQMLSPLNSPAIYAQQGSMHGSGSVHSLTAESSLTGSPVSYDHDMSGQDLVERPRKTRRKESLSSLANPPAASTRKRKAAAAAAVADTTARRSARNGSIDERAGPRKAAPSDHMNSHQGSPQPNQIINQTITMRPPPKPVSAGNTPYMDAQNGANRNNGHPPATPATLMRITSQQSDQSSVYQSPSGNKVPSPSTDVLGVGMEELHLPEAAAPSNGAASVSATPRIAPSVPSSARATPALLPRIHSAVGTPAVTALASPSTPFTNTSKNPNGRGGSRKRNSTSSNLVSPALRPRISPSIKPMLPSSADGSTNATTTAQQQLSDETHALLLASKSNYQNLLEGNHLPGVNYPSELSSNLTSKRTSHKIAEQGRRNRINTALQEMQSLLPNSPSVEGMSPHDQREGSGNSNSDGKNSDVDASGRKASMSGAASKTPQTPMTAAANATASNNSKAATVELAIEYIKNLNGENADLRKEVEGLRKRLLEATGEMDVVSPSKTEGGKSPVAVKSAAKKSAAGANGKAAPAVGKAPVVASPAPAAGVVENGASKRTK